MQIPREEGCKDALEALLKRHAGQKQQAEWEGALERYQTRLQQSSFDIGSAATKETKEEGRVDDDVDADQLMLNISVSVGTVGFFSMLDEASDSARTKVLGKFCKSMRLLRPLSLHKMKSSAQLQGLNEVAEYLQDAATKVSGSSVENCVDALCAIVLARGSLSTDLMLAHLFLRQPALANADRLLSLKQIMSSVPSSSWFPSSEVEPAKDVQEAQTFLSSLYEQPSSSASSGLRAALSVLAQLHILSWKLQLPSALSAAELSDPPPHVVGSVEDMGRLCDVLALCCPREAAEAGALPDGAEAAFKGVIGEGEEERAAGRLVVQAALSVLKVNLRFHARARRRAPKKALGEEEVKVVGRVERLLRAMMLGSEAAEVGGERGRDILVDGYSAGLPLFFNSTAALLTVLSPLLGHLGATRDEGGAGSANRRLAAIIISHTASKKAMLELLQASSGGGGGGEQGGGAGEGQGSAGAAVTALLKSLSQRLFAEVLPRVQGGEVLDLGGAEAETPRGGGGQVAWGRTSGRVTVSDDGATVTRGGAQSGRGSAAMMGRAVTYGAHEWELRVAKESGRKSLALGVASEGACRDLDAVDRGRMALWEQRGQLIPGGDGSKVPVEEFAVGDLVLMRLSMDAEGGLLEFHRNGEQVASVPCVCQNVGERLVPLLIMEREGDEVTMTRLCAGEEEGAAGSEVESDVAVACSMSISTVISVLHGQLKAGGGGSEGMLAFASALISTVLSDLQAFLAAVLELLQEKAAAAPAVLSVLSALDFVGGASTGGAQRQLLTFVPQLLALQQLTQDRGEGGALGRRVKAMMGALRGARALLVAQPALAAYDGRCFRSFSLDGIAFAEGGACLEVAHGALLHDFALELLCRRCPTPAGCEQSVLASSERFSLLLDGSSGRLSLLEVREGAPEPVVLPGGVPLDRWVLLSVVKRGPETLLFIDGRLQGAVASALPCVALAVGAAKGAADKRFLSGSVREVRLWNRALEAAEVRRSVLHGVSGEDNPGLVICVDLRGLPAPRAAVRGKTKPGVSIKLTVPDAKAEGGEGGGAGLPTGGGAAASQPAPAPPPAPPARQSAAERRAERRRSRREARSDDDEEEDEEDEEDSEEEEDEEEDEDEEAEESGDEAGAAGGVVGTPAGAGGETPGDAEGEGTKEEGLVKWGSEGEGEEGKEGKGAREGLEEHWLVEGVRVLNGQCSEVAIRMFGGGRRSKEDEEAEGWMASELFAGGIGEGTEELRALALGEAQGADAIAGLSLPKMMIRLNPLLDAMERAIIVTILHHCSVLARVCSPGPAPQPPIVEATCRSAAKAARALRQFVCERKDKEAMRLADGEEAQALEHYTQPVLDKCLLLLRIPPMCSVDRTVAAGSVPEETRASEVYRRMWQQSIGNSRVKRAIDAIADFVKSAIQPAAALAAHNLRRSRAEEMLAGLQTLLELVMLPECARMRMDTLRVLAQAELPEEHYLKGISAVGEEAENLLRSVFGDLLFQLTTVLDEKPLSAEAAQAAARALIVRVDWRDAEGVFKRELLRVLNAFWEEQGFGKARWAEREGLLKRVTELTTWLLLQQSLLAHKLEDADTAAVLALGLKAIRSLRKAAAKDAGEMLGQALETLVGAAARVGHDSRLRRQLQGREWGAAMWQLAFMPELTPETRTHALHVLSLAMLEPTQTPDDNLLPVHFDLLLRLLASLSPEGHLFPLPEVPSGAAEWGLSGKPVAVAPCLQLRKLVLQVAKTLTALPHAAPLLTSKLCAALRSIRENWAAGSLPEHTIPAVLLAGGAPEVVVGWGGEESSKGEDKVAMLEGEAVRELLQGCRAVLSSASGGAGPQWWVLRSRLMKAAWELLRLPVVQAELPAVPELLALVEALAQQRWQIPLSSELFSGDAGAPNPDNVFRSHRTNRVVKLTEFNRHARFRNTGICYAGAPMPRGSGRHYIEFRVKTNCDGMEMSVGVGFNDPAFTSLDSFTSPGMYGFTSTGNLISNGNTTMSGFGFTSEAPVSATFGALNDHVGALMDADAGTVALVVNGTVHPSQQVRYDLHSAPLHFCVGCQTGFNSGRFEIEVASELKFSGPAALRGRREWVTMENLITKTNALCASLASSAGAPSARSRPVPSSAALDGGAAAVGADGAGRAEGVRRPVQFVKACKVQHHPSAGEWLQHKERRDAMEAGFLASPPDELLKPARRPGQPKEEAGRGGEPGRWQTEGEGEERLVEVEAALAIGYARMVVLDLLSARHAGMAATVDGAALLSIVAPFFPFDGGWLEWPVAPSHPPSPRPLFRRGPYEDIPAVLNKAVIGWLHCRDHANAAALPQELAVLAEACTLAQQDVVCSQMLAAKHNTHLLCPSGHALVASPSTVTHLLPTRVPIQPPAPASEADMQPGLTLRGAVLLSQYLCSQYGLGGRAGCRPQLLELIQSLLEALLVVKVSAPRLEIQRALSVAMASCDAAVGRRMGKRMSPLLRQLHAVTLTKLEHFRNVQPPPSALFGSAPATARKMLPPLLQSIASTVVGSDLAVAHEDAALAVRRLRHLSMEGAKADGAGAMSGSKEEDKVVKLFVQMGFPRRRVERCVQATAATYMNDFGTMRVLDMLSKLSAEEAEEDSRREREGRSSEGAAREEDEEEEEADDEDENENREKALQQLEALLLTMQALRTVRDQLPLPSWLVDLAMHGCTQRKYFLCWDDADSLGGMRVDSSCRRARRRPGVEEGRWGAVLGNLPLTDENPFLSARVRGSGRKWYAQACFGVVLRGKAEWSPAERQALAASGRPQGACVLWPMGQKQVLVVARAGAEPQWVSTGRAYQPGHLVGVRWEQSKQQVEIFHSAERGKDPEKVAEATMEEPGSAVVPLLTLLNSRLSFTVTEHNMPLPFPTFSGQRLRSVAHGPRAIPCRNSLWTSSGLDWHAALDSTWPTSVDALLVEYAVQRASVKKVKPDKLDVHDLFEKKVDAEQHPSSESVEMSKTLQREISALPPTIRSVSGLSAALLNPAAAAHHNKAHPITATLPQQPGQPFVVPRLSQIPPEALMARFAVIKALNEQVREAMPLIDLQLFEHRHEMGHLLARSKGLMLPNLKEEAFRSTVTETKGHGSTPNFRVNRGTVVAKKRPFERTVFRQVMKLVEKHRSSLIEVQERGRGQLQAWTMDFEGEGGSDHGGLFRESLKEMAEELQSRKGSLRLFLPCPNQRLAVGTNQDKWVPNPSCKAEKHLEMYRFVGKLMGVAIRTESAIELDLPSLVWKPMVGEVCALGDIAGVDDMFGKEMETLKAVRTKEQWTAHDKKWQVRSMSGRMVNLVPNGGSVPVQFHEREAYVSEACNLRLKECAPQTSAILEGLSTVVPRLVLPIMTWRELENTICGTPVIDPEKLKKITTYENFSGGANHATAVMFWKVVEGMSNEDRGALLAFAWGRRRMPAENSGAQFKISLMTGMNDGHLPASHTCFFQIDLPRYSDEDVMREKLLYAIHSCVSIDNDGRADGVLFSVDESNEDDSQAVQDALDETAEETEGRLEVEAAAGDGSWVLLPPDGGHRQAAAEGVGS